MAKIRDCKREQHGFTLIEIIAVLVILGILAVVAVPKYLDLQTESKNSAAKGLVAAVQSQLSMGYSANKLNSTTSPDPLTECNKVKISSGTSGGNISCAGTTWAANVTITANVNGGSDVTGYWNSPEAATSS